MLFMVREERVLLWCLVDAVVLLLRVRVGCVFLGIFVLNGVFVFSLCWQGICML